MRYDLSRIHEQCQESGIPSRIVDEQNLEIDLGHGAVLRFENAEREEDCLIGFAGMLWHTHDDLMFVDGRHNYAKLNYLDLVKDLKEGRVLVCERQVDGLIVDRWLIHSEFNDEFKYLEEGERIIVHRASTRPVPCTVRELNVIKNED